MANSKPAGPGPVPLAPLLHALGAVSAWLDATATPGAIVGGVAASILGRPRLTEDIDVLVLLEPEEWSAFLAAGRQLGFVPRTDDALDFARTSRVLLVTHQPSDLRLDVVLGAMPLEEEIVYGAAKVEIAGVAVPLPSKDGSDRARGKARRLVRSFLASGKAVERSRKRIEASTRTIRAGRSSRLTEPSNVRVWPRRHCAWCAHSASRITKPASTVRFT